MVAVVEARVRDGVTLDLKQAKACCEGFRMRFGTSVANVGSVCLPRHRFPAETSRRPIASNVLVQTRARASRCEGGGADRCRVTHCFAPPISARKKLIHAMSVPLWRDRAATSLAPKVANCSLRSTAVV
jgi:hypothetical protein